eukprot:scaffold14658_cov67-Phaeocystis_antarctica.AAC.17
MATSASPHSSMAFSSPQTRSIVGVCTKTNSGWSHGMSCASTPSCTTCSNGTTARATCTDAVGARLVHGKHMMKTLS